MLVWTDLETTGLEADKCSVLEVAAIITDDDLNKVDSTAYVVYFDKAADITDRLQSLTANPDVHPDPQQAIYRVVANEFGIHERVIEMHDKNQLWTDCVWGIALDTVDRALAKWVKRYAHVTETYIDEKTGEQKTRTVKPQLAGSTISFDRGFIDRHLPLFSKTLHYRNVDVSSFNEVARRNWPELYAGRPRTDEKAAHRGLPDILTSLNTLRYYVNRLGPMAVGIEGNPNP